MWKCARGLDLALSTPYPTSGTALICRKFFIFYIAFERSGLYGFGILLPKEEDQENGRKWGRDFCHIEKYRSRSFHRYSNVKTFLYDHIGRKWKCRAFMGKRFIMILPSPLFPPSLYVFRYSYNDALSIPCYNIKFLLPYPYAHTAMQTSPDPEPLPHLKLWWSGIGLGHLF
jgi:hypothetical protein